MSQTSQPMPVTAIHEVYLPVTSILESADWYHTHFGAAISWESHESARVTFPEGGFTLIGADRLNPYVHIPFNLHAYLRVGGSTSFSALPSTVKRKKAAPSSRKDAPLA